MMLQGKNQFRFDLKEIYTPNQKPFSPTMQSSNQQPIVKVSGAAIHKLSLTTRRKLQEGSCSIYQQADNYFFKVHNFSQNLKDITFGEMKYEGSNSYFFIEDVEVGFINILSISLADNSDQVVKQFRDTLGKYSTVRQLLALSNECELYKRVQQAYPEFQTKQVRSKNALTKLTKQVGSLVGALSGFVGKPVDKVGHVIEEKKDELYQSRLSTENKGKWDYFKQTAASLNQKLTEGIKPASDSVKNLSSSIGHSFNHSNNSIIKAVRDISKKTKDALNQGYMQANGDNIQNHKPLPAESDSVMEIKVEKQTAN